MGNGKKQEAIPKRIAPAAIVLHPQISKATKLYDRRMRLEEACGLAKAIRLTVAYSETVTVTRPRPSLLFGEGVVSRIKEIVVEKEIEVVIVDYKITPGQQRNLERAWRTKVIDRTGLILEIFGERARTREGQLQVELAHLTYQKSRLVRSWTHLERQRGGAGFLGGPGETQIEIDRRLIGERIARLRKELNKVVRTRNLHRAARKRVPYSIVALVGYTNAGKSTIFNALTKSEVFVQDQLFATLDPTMRGVQLPSGRKIILSDTVGFVSELPPELIAAFRATLEEVIEADVIVHVRDISHSETENQKADVEGVLARMGIIPGVGERPYSHTLIEAHNKIDLMDARERAVHMSQDETNKDSVMVSGLTGEGTDKLIGSIEDHISANRCELEVAIPLADGKTLAWLYRRGEVINREDGEEETKLKVLLEEADINRLTLNETVRLL